MARPPSKSAARAILALVIAATFAISFLATPRLGAGWVWDLGNGLGFLAMAGLLFQMIPYPRSGAARRHEWLGYLVLGAAMAHGFWLLAGDDAVRVYLTPGGPHYMWLGLIGLLALALLTALARMPDRMRVHGNFRNFRRWHRRLGFLAVAGSGLHVLLSGFYLSGWAQALLLALLAAATCFGRGLWAKLGAAPVASSRAFLAVGAVAVGLFVLMRNLPA